MRIAYFVDRFPLVSETFVLAQITGMIDRGHDVTIFANRLVEPDAQHEAVARYDLIKRTILLRPASRNPAVRLTQALRAIFSAVRTGCLRVALRALNVVRFGREALNLKLLVRSAQHYGGSKFEIVHCQFGQLGVGAVTLKQCGALEGALVTSFRGTDAMKYASRNPARFSNLFQGADRFLVVSEAVQKRLIELGCPADRIQILRSGIDLTRFRARGSGNLHQPVRLVSIGRLAPNKGISYALRALRLMRDSGLDIHYQIVGNGPSRESLLQEAADLKIGSAVTFEGAIDSNRVIEILGESDILITPSITGPQGEQEGLPNSLKEAMAIGVLAIGTDIGGTPELIKNGINGYLISEKDAAAIAKCIESVVSNWDIVTPLIAEARRTVQSEFDISSLNDDLEETYKELAAGS